MVRWRRRAVSWRDIAAICCCCGRDGTAVQRALGLKLISEEEQRRLLHAYDPETDRFAGPSNESPEATKAAAAAAEAAAMYPFRSRGSLRYIGEAFLFDDFLHVPPEGSGSRSCLGCRASLVSPLEPEGGIVLRLRRARIDNEKRGSREIRHLSSRDLNTLKEAGGDSPTRTDRVSFLAEYSTTGGNSWLRAKKDEGRYREDNSTVETLTTSATSLDGKRGTGLGSCFSRGSEDLSLSTARSPTGGFSSPPRDGDVLLSGQKPPDITPGRLVESDGIRITDLVHRERRRVREEGRDAGEANSESDEDEFLFFPTRVYCSGGSRGETDIPSAAEAVARLTSRQPGDGVFGGDSSRGVFPAGHPLAEQGALREREDLAGSVSSSELRELRSEAEGQRSDDGNGIRELGDSGRHMVGGPLTNESCPGQCSRPGSTGSQDGDMLQYMGSTRVYGIPRNGRPANSFAGRMLDKQQLSNQKSGGNTVPSTLRDTRRLSDIDRQCEGNGDGFLAGGGRRAFAMIDACDDAPAQREALAAAGLIDAARRSAGWCTANRREQNGQGEVPSESEADHLTGFSPRVEPAARRQPYCAGRGSAGAGEIAHPSHFQRELEGGTDSGLVGLCGPDSQRRRQSGRFEAGLEDLARTRRHEGACAKRYSSFTGLSRHDSRDATTRPAGFFRENSHTSDADGVWPGSCSACDVRSVGRKLPDIGERAAHDLLEVNSYERPSDQAPGERETRDHSGCAPTGFRGEHYSTIRRTVSLGERHSPVSSGPTCPVKEDFRVGARGVSLSRRVSPSEISGCLRSTFDWVRERQDGHHEADKVIEACRASTRGMSEDTPISRRGRGISFPEQSEGDEERMNKKDALLRRWPGRRSLVYSLPEGDILGPARGKEDYVLSQGTGEFFSPRTPRRPFSSYRVDPPCRAASSGHTVESRAPFTGNRFSSLSFSDRRPFSSHLPSSSSGTDSHGCAFEDVRSFASTRSFSVGSRICRQPSEKGERDLHCHDYSDGFSPRDPTVFSPSSRSASFRERDSINSGRGWLGRVNPEELRRGIEEDTRRQRTCTGKLVTEWADGRREEHGPVVPPGHARRSRESGGFEPFYRNRGSSPGDDESFPLRTRESSADKLLLERRAVSASPGNYPKRASTSSRVQLSGERERPLVVGGLHLSGGLLPACSPTGEPESRRVGCPRPVGAPSATSEEKESLRGSGSYSDRDSLYLTPREE
ncbi:hypothetical protein CSUI_000116 [Cystoisospora suis]|uniref:Uncharacterized protein n=1 Tax=Cystoisospora suis TaxID=483139 RepID=A0A2C6LHP7_9APIC|nr:hypothetical protein CSUI_000116 [Cystoisospora suis]